VVLPRLVEDECVAWEVGYNGDGDGDGGAQCE
jgi:hypothetical protein